MTRGELTARDFIAILNESRLNGFGVVPLVGAGLSAPSGVPIITEVKAYLHKCIARALGLDHPEAWQPDASPEQIEAGFARLDLYRFRRWLPERDCWPPFGSPQAYARDPVDWVDRLKDTYLEMDARARLTSNSDYPELYVFQEAFGASADWRSLLMFLSRLRRKPAESTTDGQSIHQLYLGSPNLDIVDTFFLNVVEGKRPTLGHRMLARLSGPLRINTLLTTNFDDLLERAFVETANHFTTFDVHVDTGLPPYRDLEGRNSIVKLHGGRYGLRADYSLDRPPTDDDLRHFASYLADREITESEWYHARGELHRNAAGQHRSAIVAKRHLLIVGMSASDERINAMLRAAAETLANFKVYWIAYRRSDIERAAILLSQLYGSSSGGTLRGNAPHRTPHYALVRHQFPGLLFLQTYQEVLRALPSSRVVFPSAARLPVPPELTDAAKHEKPLKTLEDNLINRINECVASTDHGSEFTRVVLMHAPFNRYFGASTAAARTFDRLLDGGKQCVWIDLDEVSSGNDLFELLLHSIARKAGITDWMPVLLQTDATEADRSRIENAQVREIARLTNSPNRQWMVFLNARSGAGINSLGEQQFARERRVRPNGWLDLTEQDTSDASDPTANGDALIQLLKRLGSSACPNVTVILLCYDVRKDDRIVDSGFFGRIRNTLPEIPEPLQIDDNALGEKGDDQFATKTLIDHGLKWAKRFKKWSSARHHFLYALVLASRARYAASLWSWPCRPPEVPLSKWMSLANEWLEELEQLHVVRRKRGGYIWMHCDIRNGLRRRLPNQLSELNRKTVGIHEGWAEWYHKLFESSDDTDAVFEIVYHRCKQCETLLHKLSGLKFGGLRIVNALSDARLALERARHGMLVSGYSKGLCRRIQVIRSELLESVELAAERLEARSSDPRHAKIFSRIRTGLLLLNEVSLRLNRSVAREVGENTVAFQRHRELRILQYVTRFKKRVRSLEQKRKAIQRLEDEWCNGSETERNECAKKVLNPHEYHMTTSEPISEWIESCCELGTLGIAIRSYEYARRSFSYVCDRFDLPARQLLTDREPIFSRLSVLHKWLDGELPNACKRELKLKDNPFVIESCVQHVLRGIVLTLQRRQQLMLAIGHGLHTLSRRSSRRKAAVSRNNEALAAFYEARRCCELGLELQRHIDAERQVAMFPDDVRIRARDNVHRHYDDRQRFNTQDALACSFLGEFDKAHRRLNEAEASLSEVTSVKGRLEHAIIDLHRSEILTHQAVFDAAGKGLPMMSSFAKRRHEIRVAVSDERPPSLEVLAKLVVKRGVKGRELRRSQSFIDDAWQTSSRAEVLLSQNRKNVWWTTWYLELRLKLVELDLWAAIVRGGAEPEAGFGTPLPHLGMEAAAYGTPTVADWLVDSADRMVRLDLYRMARVVESYANCLLGLILWREHWRLHSDVNGVAENLRRRQLEMRETVIRLCKSLKQRIKRRRELDSREMGKSTSVDECVKEYLEFLLGSENDDADCLGSPDAYLGRILVLAESGLWSF